VSGGKTYALNYMGLSLFPTNLASYTFASGYLRTDKGACFIVQYCANIANYYGGKTFMVVLRPGQGQYQCYWAAALYNDPSIFTVADYSASYVYNYGSISG
jgi:hypothetical protein